MNAGKLDRRIVIQQAAEAQDAAGEPIASWTELDKVWAAYEPARAEERFTEAQRAAITVAKFRIRWRADLALTPKQQRRIVHDGRNYDITGVQEIGRREGLLIEAFARAE